MKKFKLSAKARLTAKAALAGDPEHNQMIDPMREVFDEDVPDEDSPPQVESVKLAAKARLKGDLLG